VIVYMSHLVRDKRNARAEFRQPVVSVVRRDKLMYVNEVRVKDSSGKVICRVVYDPKVDPSKYHKVSAWVEVDESAADVEFL
jgi:hypothetical protein